MTPRVIPPGSTIGVLGSGQLGRMFALAARAMGYRIHVYSPEAYAPTAHVADRETVAPYDDLEVVRAFGHEVDVVTFEFENVPAATVEALEALVPVRPSGRSLWISQNRLREKSFLRDLGLPVADFCAIHSIDDLQQAVASLRGSAILKTAGWGYDGKGQVRLGSDSDLGAAWDSLGTDAAICEELVDFACEVSVIGARSVTGEFAAFPVFENQHRHHILDLTCCPARIPESLAAEAVALAERILRELEVIGVMCIELFVTRDGRLLINELAPRPHNSGHLTIDACATSQFAQQVRAVCGLPLGDPALLQPAAMANLLGDLWSEGEPDWASALADPAISLHLYGKSEPRQGRKMGHLTATAADVDTASERVSTARERLNRDRST